MKAATMTPEEARSFQGYSVGNAVLVKTVLYEKPTLFKARERLEARANQIRCS